MLKLIAKTQSRLQSLKDDTEGATMIEYSLLIGLISVVLITALLAVGIWANGQWAALQTAIGA